jgi:hypothetical protein
MYIKFDSNNTKKYKILLGFLIIVILLVILIINKYSNDEIHVISSNSRRLITNLNNYTETMSEFMVNDDVKIQEQLMKTLNEFQERQLNIQEQLIRSVNDFQERQLKNQEQLIRSVNVFQEKQLKKDEEHKKLIIKDIVIKRIDEKMISKSGSTYVNEDKCYIKECVKNILNIKNENMCSLMLNIDYENMIASYNYYNQTINNYITNNIVNPNDLSIIINNPVYISIKKVIDEYKNQENNKSYIYDCMIKDYQSRYDYNYAEIGKFLYISTDLTHLSQRHNTYYSTIYSVLNVYLNIPVIKPFKI